MSFVKTLIRSKKCWLNPSSGGLWNKVVISSSSTSVADKFPNAVQSPFPLGFFRSKATFGCEIRKFIVAAPMSSLESNSSCVNQSSLAHNKFRCKSTFECTRLPDDIEGFTGELRDFIDKAEAMTVAGNKDGLTDFLIGKLEEVKQKVISGHKGIDQALVLDFIGMSYMSINDTESVDSVLEVLAEVVESIKGMDLNSAMVLLQVLGHMALMYSKLGKYKESAFAMKKTISMIEIKAKFFGNCDGELGEAMQTLAILKRVLGDVDEAICLYKKALNLLKDSKDKNLLKRDKEDLANFLYHVGREGEAQELLEECLEVTEKSNGTEEDFRSAMNMCNLGVCRLDAEKFEEAETMLRTGLQKLAKFVSPDDPILSKPKMQLTRALFHLRKGKEAEELALEALHAIEKAFGEDSFEVVDALDHLWAARLLPPKIDNEGQLETLKRSLRIQEKAGKEESELFVMTLKRMAAHLERLGRNDEKLAVEKRMLGIQMKILKS